MTFKPFDGHGRPTYEQQLAVACDKSLDPDKRLHWAIGAAVEKFGGNISTFKILQAIQAAGLKPTNID